MRSPEQPALNAQEERPSIEETGTTMSYLGVTLEKAEVRESDFVPEREKLESFYINDEFSIELQRKIAIAMKLGQNLLIEGGTAIGKTTTVAKMCAELGYELHYANLNGQTDVENLMGRYIPNVRREKETDPEFEFADGAVTSGLRQEKGKVKVIVLDEVNASHPGVLKRLNEILNAVEQGGTVTLTEDASEQISVSKETTLVIALMNPSGKGYLGVDPISREFINRFVYQSEAEELPRESFLFSLKSRTGRGPKTASMSQERFVHDPQARLTLEQFAEIPGIDEIELRYAEFHFAAKELLKARKIAGEQSQPFLFDDRRDSERVLEYVMHFYNGDISETFQQALRYYYAGKLESEEDRATLEELILNVEYTPPVSTKRRGLEEGAGEDGEEAPETETDPELDAVFAEARRLRRGVEGGSEHLELSEHAEKLAEKLEKQLSDRYAEFDIPKGKRPKIETPAIPDGLTPEHLEAVKEALGGGLEERVLPSLESLNGMDEDYMKVMYPETQREKDTARGLTSYRPRWWGGSAEIEGFSFSGTLGDAYTASMKKELKELGGALVLLDTATKPKYIDGSQHYGTAEGEDKRKDPLEEVFKHVAEQIRKGGIEVPKDQKWKISNNRFKWSHENLEYVLEHARGKILKKFREAGLTGIDVEISLVPAVLDNMEMTLRNPASSSTNTLEWTSTPFLDDKENDTGHRLDVGHSEEGGASVMGRGLGSVRLVNRGARLAVMFKKATDS